MRIELYLISPHEEYVDKHACRKHWNFQWGGRRGKTYVNEGIKVRRESFGGLMKAPDSKLYRLDHEAYFWLDLLFGNN